MRMPWGKFRGQELEQVPDDYLLWVLDRCDNLSPTLTEAIQNRLELHRRLPPRLDVVLSDWHRQLARDFGNSAEAMRTINEAYRRLRQMVGLSPQDRRQYRPCRDGETG